MPSVIMHFSKGSYVNLSATSSHRGRWQSGDGLLAPRSAEPIVDPADPVAGSPRCCDAAVDHNAKRFRFQQGGKQRDLKPVNSPKWWL